jgi:myo-inositol-1(or 4)-monophosphatase
VSKRSVSDLVTDADYASEEAMLDTLVSAVPDDGWLTEESGFRRGTSNRTWVIDPLDGTVNYATGLDDFGVIVGLVENGSPVAGGMYLPVVDLMYLAERGNGAERNGTPIHVSTTKNLSEAVFDHSLSSIAGSITEQARTLAALIRTARGVRCVHSLTYLARVAEGIYDGFVYHSLGLWDVCGPSVILEEAGGALARVDGQPLDLRPSPEAGTEILAVMCANPALLQEVRNVLGSP